MAKAEYGDIIYTKHKMYRHYGIYINEDCVIHYDGKSDDVFLRAMCIRETTMDRFLGNKKCYYIDNRVGKFNNEEVEKLNTIYDKLKNVVDDFCNISLENLKSKYNSK